MIQASSLQISVEPLSSSSVDLASSMHVSSTWHGATAALLPWEKWLVSPWKTLEKKQ
jgi:hypothetical protein